MIHNKGYSCFTAMLLTLSLIEGLENSFLSLSCGIIFDAKHPKKFLSLKFVEGGGVIEVAESEIKKSLKFEVRG